MLWLVTFLNGRLSFRFDIVGGAWNLIVSGPDHCHFTLFKIYSKGTKAFAEVFIISGPVTARTDFKKILLYCQCCKTVPS